MVNRGDFAVGQGIAGAFNRRLDCQVYFREMLAILQKLDTSLDLVETSDDGKWSLFTDSERKDFPSFSIAFQEYIKLFIMHHQIGIARDK